MSCLTTTKYKLAMKKLRAKNAKTGMLLHIFLKFCLNLIIVKLLQTGCFKQLVFSLASLATFQK